jgi:hypothetical protein
MNNMYQFLLAGGKTELASPNARIKVTEIRIAPHVFTIASRNIGSASIASAFPIKRVQSSRCWFLTTGKILAAPINPGS